MKTLEQTKITSLRAQISSLRAENNNLRKQRNAMRDAYSETLIRLAGHKEFRESRTKLIGLSNELKELYHD